MSNGNTPEALHQIIFESRSRENDLIKFALNSSRAERESLRNNYDTAYPETGLIQDIQDRFSGNFKDLMYRLFLTRPEYDAEQYIRGMGGVSTDSPALYELLFSTPQWLIDETKNLYTRMTNKNLSDDLAKALPNPVKKVIPIFLNTQRRTEKNPNEQQCQKAAELLINEAPDNWIKNEQIVKDIFATMSPEELVLISRFYLATTGTSITEAVAKLSGNTREFLLSMLTYLINPAEMFAKRINESVKGLGTDTNLLDRIILNRHDLDLDLIKKYYYKLFNTSIREDIEDDTSGTYKKMLIALTNKLSPDDV